MGLWIILSHSPVTLATRQPPNYYFIYKFIALIFLSSPLFSQIWSYEYFIMNHFVYHNLFLSSSVFLHTFPLSLSLSSPPLSYSLALLVLEILYSLTNLCIIPLIINFSIPSPYPSSVFKLPLSNSMIRLLPFPFFIYNLSLTHLFFGNRLLIFSWINCLQVLW